MANPDHVARLNDGVTEWNSWRMDNLAILPDLSGADLSRAHLNHANLSEANLTEAYLGGSYLSKANLSRADLSEANLSRADLSRADLNRANLSEAYLAEAYLSEANLSEAYLAEADLGEAHLNHANLSGANLSEADLNRANLSGANLSRAHLSRANLGLAVLIGADLRGANLTGSFVYGLSAWDVQLEGTIQSNLVITPKGVPAITVDNLEIAQFIYLLLNNKSIRHVIDTITSKVVLILGRFTHERKVILDAIRDELRKQDYLPVLFDFDKSSHRDITETVSTLAHIARFVIADLSDPKSIPHELAHVAPLLPSVPIMPLIGRPQKEYSMFEHFFGFRHVLKPFRYRDGPHLMSVLSDKVIAPAERLAQRVAGRRR
jgi:uncharacterized protein YjbI with pentapeptide repeats